MAEQPAAPPSTEAADVPKGLTGERKPSVAEQGRLSLDEAVGQLNEADAAEREERERDEKGRFKAKSADEPEETQDPDGAAGDREPGPEPETSEEEDEPSDAPEGDEDEPVEEAAAEPAPDEAKTRLRDGTEVAIGDLKKAYDELQEVKKGGIPSDIRQEIDKVASDLRQRQEYLDKTLPLAIETLKSQLPAEPSDELWDADPIEAGIQQRKHDKALRQLQQLTGASQEQTQRQQQEQQQQFQAYIQEQQQKLHQARPELKDPAKAQEFYDKYVKLGQKLGFEKAELDQTYDTRLILGMMSLAEKAEKWDKLQASKPKAAEKVKRAVPMAQPGRRVEPEQRKNAEVEKFQRRFNESPTIDNAAALLTKLGI